MDESNTLVLVNNRTLTPETWQMISQIAPVIHQSRMFGVSSIEQAAATMLKGFDLGLPLTTSFEFVKVILGKPELIPRGALALLHNSPVIKSIQVNRMEKNGKFLGYECCMERINGFAFTARWTLEDAQRADLIKPDSGWAKYPENMCMWRAIGFCADVVAPDVTGGMTGLMKMPEQYGVALSEQGDVIDAVQPVQTAPVESPAAPTTPEFTLDDLCNMFGAEAVLVANAGKIPGTTEEVQAVAIKLAGGVGNGQ